VEHVELAPGRRVMSSVGRVAARLGAQPKDRTAGYAFCAKDEYWFRPAYTEGKCPLCGAVPEEATPMPLGMDRSWYGTAVLALESLVMVALVLVLYFRG
jgi:hypothetical protein